LVGKVQSTGKTTGKILTTTTSAQASIKNVDLGYTSYCERKIAVGKSSATSKCSFPLGASTQFFTGLSTHTATNNGVIYNAVTSDSDLF
uniref:hypothetical protein n=1 Tax=Metabacillus niabensis TaxID=324854 RepID=UPI0039AF6B35